MIAVNNIAKSFGKTAVLKGISAEFEQGKTNLIIGQSGSGKTVFLKCILGLHRVTGGEIIYNKVPLSSMEEEEQSLLRLREQHGLHRQVLDKVDLCLGRHL